MFVLGVDPELLAGELLVVAAQRLSTKICPECKTTYTPADEVLADFYPMGVPGWVKFYKGAGCSKCDGLGHKGRIVLSEFWFADHESKMLIARRASEDVIINDGIGRSFFPILQDALEKVHAGIVDISSLPGVLPMASLQATARLIQEKELLAPEPEPGPSPAPTPKPAAA